MFAVGFLIQGAVLATLLLTLGGDTVRLPHHRLALLLVAVVSGCTAVHWMLPLPFSLVPAAALGTVLIRILSSLSWKRSLLIATAFTAVSSVLGAALQGFSGF